MAQEAPRVYVPEPPAVGASGGLPDQAAHHLLKVLRLKPGAELRLFDGVGNEFLGRLSDVGRPTRVEVMARVRTEPEPELSITLGVGVSRGERMNWVIQKSVELGVARIQPLLTERTSVHLDANRADKKQAHWQGVMIAACEQSARCHLAPIKPVARLDEWLSTHPAGLVLSPAATQGLRDQTAPRESLSLLVGPEGGLAPHEIKAALQAGWTQVQLGPRVLRTETAPVAALAAIQVLWGDWR